MWCTCEENFKNIVWRTGVHKEEKMFSSFLGIIYFKILIWRED